MVGAVMKREVMKRIFKPLDQRNSSRERPLMAICLAVLMACCQGSNQGGNDGGLDGSGLPPLPVKQPLAFPEDDRKGQ